MDVSIAPHRYREWYNSSMNQEIAGEARDRLLLAAAQLLDAADGEPISTRAICDRAGVRAPTLYHHFGDKQGLLDAVINHGFKQFLGARRGQSEPHDPIGDIRDAWDNHVQFGLAHPNFYTAIYGRVQPGQPCGVIEGVKAMILEALRPAARQGRLRVPPTNAAEQVLAASVGVTLSLITQPPERVDLRLSDQVRDALLASLTTAPPPGESAGASEGTGRTVATAAVALASALDEDGTALSPAELALFREWLARLNAS
jgi:AcrR family transcriptional regulator